MTGPTGSGKSTSLYAALNKLNTVEKNIITIEDPVEYQLEGLTQVQVNNKARLTFAAGLRSMMRADPDIIMVGEIRDRETAQIGIEAALTGHLVLSTLHTNDAPGAITRLIEMGIEPFLVGSAVDCVVAQRLARLLCAECKRRVTLRAEVLRANGFNVGLDLECYEPAGCARCGGTGYQGRVGLYEVMWVSPTIRSLAVAREPAELIAAAAVDEGMMRLREDGLGEVRRGLTSIAEIARVAGSRQGRDPTTDPRRRCRYSERHEPRLLRNPPRSRPQKASDLHITAGAPPMLRVRGSLVPVDGAPMLTATDTREIVYAILNSSQRQRLESEWQIDFAYSIPGHARFRVNAYFQRGTIGAAFRLILPRPCRSSSSACRR